MQRFSWIAVVVVLGGMLFFCGCNDNPLGRQSVSGMVKLDGKPLEQGMIAFEPKQRGKGHVGGGAKIKDGHYTISTEKGLPPDEYWVRIYSAVEAKQAPANAQTDGPDIGAHGGVSLIPPKYNGAQTELEATVEEGKPCKFDYDLKSR
ncbi:MAG: hypothetical protein PVH19_02035 [Planctomycetia bacterium]|jgi:hypothetical protein